MTAVTIDQMSKLLTVEQLTKKLQSTEPLAALQFDTSTDQAKFNFPVGWNVGLKEAEGSVLTDATVQIGGTESRLTKDAALQATSLIGLTKDYVSRTPGDMITSHVNYWMGGHRGEMYQLLSKQGEGLAFTKASLEPFSNIGILDVALDSIEKMYGKTARDGVKVDYKHAHDLRRSAFRLIVPEKIRVIESARNGGTEDSWSIGIDVRNSLTGEKPLRIAGYLFSYFCTNGSTSTHASSGNYQRRSMGSSPDDAFEWARTSVDEILGGLEHELDSVAELTTMKLDDKGELSDTIHALFERYRVPAQARESIIGALIESDDLTAYGLMNAVTQAANVEGMSASIVESLLQVGGDIPFTMSERCTKCHRFQL